MLTHDFTRAEITFAPSTAVGGLAEFLGRYADVVGCDHPPVG